MEHVEPIVWKGRPLAYIVRGELSPDRTTFTTPDEFNLQIGYVELLPSNPLTPGLRYLDLKAVLGNSVHIGTVRVVIANR